MKRVVATTFSLLFTLGLVACDKEEAKSEEKKEAKEDESKEVAKKEADTKEEAKAETKKEAEPVKDDTKGLGGIVHEAAGDEAATAGAEAAVAGAEAAAAGAEAAAAGAEAAAAGAAAAAAGAEAKPVPHFDTSKDKGSLIGHLAGSIAHDEDLAGAEGTAAELAKLAGEEGVKTPTDQEICGHVWNAIFKTEFADMIQDGMEEEFLKMCEEEVEKERIKLGPDVFAQDAACIMASTTLEELELCDKAEQEAEEELHANPHGDGVDRETCVAAVDHIFGLIKKDLTDEEKAIMAAFEEDMKVIHEDAVLACMDEATKAELECAMKAETLEGLEVCE